MKKVLIVVFAVAIGLSGVANAQTPHVAVYFDHGLQYQQADCPGAPIGTVSQTLYVVANNFGLWLNGIEFQIFYPTQLMFLGDELIGDAISIGNSAAGIGIAFPTPVEAFVQAKVLKVTVLWMCNSCNPDIEYPMVVMPYPGQPWVRAVEWPNLNVHIGIGFTSLVCSTTPVQETTWGQVKALYR